MIKERIKAMKSIPENIKASMFFGIASFSISGIKYMTTPIFTRLMTTDEYGVISIFNSWLSIVQIIMSLTLIYPGILNVGLYEHKNNRWRYLSNMLGIITVISTMIIIAYFFNMSFFNRLFNIPQSLVVLLLCTCMIKPATELWTVKQRYEFKYKIAVPVTVGSALAAQFVSIIFVVINKNNGGNLAIIRLWSAGAVELLVGLILYFYILNKGKVFYDKELWKRTIIIAIPLIPHYLGQVVLNAIDKIMIGHMVGDDKAGIYGLAAILASIGFLFWRALLITFSPFVNVKLGERKFSDIREVIAPLWMFVGALCIIGSILAPEMIRIFATEEYLEGIRAVPPVVAGVFAYAMYDAFAAVAFFHKKSISIMICSVVAAISNVVMNYYGIMRYGYIAAGYTTLFSYLLLIIMHYWNSRRIEKEKIYDEKAILTTLLIVILGCMSCNLLYSTMPIIRYVLAGGIFSAIIYKKKTIYLTLEKMMV